MKNHKKAIIIGAAFIVVALCITGAYMIVTWEPDDSIKPFSADFVSYDNTPSKGNELWDAMVETGAEGIEEIVITPGIYSSYSVRLRETETIAEFIDQCSFEKMNFNQQEPPKSMDGPMYEVFIEVFDKSGRYFRVVVYSNGCAEKVEVQGEERITLYSSYPVDIQPYNDYISEHR